MSYADVTPILTAGVTTLTETLVAILGILLPVMIIIGLVWYGVHKLRKGGK